MSLPNHHFAIITSRLLIIPTPLAIASSKYVTLYASLHADPKFCEMGFGHHFLPRTWSLEEAREVILTRDIQRCWEKRSMGDCAVGMRPEHMTLQESAKEMEISILKGRELEDLITPEALESIEWIGYAGVRDATTTSLPDLLPTDPALPHFLEMIELRYGVAPAYWGKGVAREAAEGVMQWATKERGVKRFIAETEKLNVRSGRVLEKMGFRLSGTNYWKEDSEVEWERVVG